MSDDFVKKQNFADDEVHARYVGVRSLAPSQCPSAPLTRLSALQMSSAAVAEQNARIEAENARIRAENERAKQDAARRNADQKAAANSLAARAAALQAQLPK